MPDGDTLGDNSHRRLFGGEETGVDGVGHRRGIVDVEPSRHARRVVELLVEAADPVHEAPHPLVLTGHAQEAVVLEAHAGGHVEADHDDLPGGGEHDVRGMGIAPHIGFGHRGDVATGGRRAAHEHDLLDELRQARLEGQGQGEVREAADRDERHFPGIDGGPWPR